MRQMTVLRARESIQRINEMMYVSGLQMEKNEARTYMRQLELEAAAGERSGSVAERPTSIEEMARRVGKGTKVARD